MMGKQYYTIDTKNISYPVHWLDLHGVKHVDTIDSVVKGHVDYSPGDVMAEFELLHPGIVWLDWGDYQKRLAGIEEDKWKLECWNNRWGI